MAFEDSISEEAFNESLKVFYKATGEGRKFNNTVTFSSYVKSRNLPNELCYLAKVIFIQKLESTALFM